MNVYDYIQSIAREATILRLKQNARAAKIFSLLFIHNKPLLIKGNKIMWRQ